MILTIDNFDVRIKMKITEHIPKDENRDRTTKHDKYKRDYFT